MNTLYRYPGVKPFETQDRQIFFGRDQDVNDLYDLICLEKLVVLFSKSGYGKSSLLNAGVIPKLLEAEEDNGRHYQPVSIRFGAYQEGLSRSPIQTTLGQLRQAFEDINPAGDFLPETRLWHYCKRRQKPQCTMLFIFDQFEEFFSYPQEQQKFFKEQAAELLYVKIPQDLRQNAGTYRQEQSDFLGRFLDVKMVFSIRSDRMHYLDSLKDSMPDILYKRYELYPLNRRQAREAMTGPARLERPMQIGVGETIVFASPCFQYSDAALQHVLDSLSNNSKARVGEIETFVLQIVCRRIEERVIEKQKKREDVQKVVVHRKDLPNLNKVYADYYRDELKKLKRQERRIARRLLEDELLSIEEETGETYRLSIDGRALLQNTKSRHANQALLDRLVQAFLMRREPNNTGGDNYEISHDTLTPPIFQARERRRMFAKWIKRAVVAVGVFLAVYFITIALLRIELWKTQERLSQTSKELENKKVELLEKEDSLRREKRMREEIYVIFPSDSGGVPLEYDNVGRPDSVRVEKKMVVIPNFDAFLDHAENFIRIGEFDLAQKTHDVCKKLLKTEAFQAMNAAEREKLEEKLIDLDSKINNMRSQN